MGSHKPKAPADDIESWLQDYPTEEDKGGTRRRPKYPPVESPPPDALDRLTDRDQKLLAALVKKYGKVITEAAAKIVAPARRRGRPRRGEDPRFERMHLADFFDELVEEHREAGSRHPKLAAMRELFQIARPSRTGDRAAFRRFAATVERKLPAGRRDLKVAKEMATAIEHYRGSRNPRKRRAKKSRE